MLSRRMQQFQEWLRSHALTVRTGLLLYWVAMFLGTHIPKVPEPLEKVSDKTLHFSGYLGLYLFLTCDAIARGKWSPVRAGMLWLVCALYAAGDEILQIPVGRSADVRDWIADIEGVSLAAVAVGSLAFFVSRRQNNATAPKETIPKEKGEDQRTEK